MSERCMRCFRPVQNCLCRYTKEIDSGVKFVFLMHPKEAKKQRTGTGRIAHVTLRDSEILVGLEFAHNARLSQLLSSPEFFPVLLYPGEDAWNARKDGFVQAVGGRKLLVLVIDATWFCSRKIIEHNPFLLELPRLSFYGDYRSIFTFKREPRPEYISTIESCYYLIEELKTVSLAAEVNPSPLMDVFRRMIKDQLQAENERILGIRPNSHCYDAKYTKLKEIPAEISGEN